MRYEAEHQVNQAAFERLKDEIDNSYSKGRFVAIGNGEIIADTSSIETMLDKLNEMGLEPRKIMVVKVGHYPHGNIYRSA